MGALGVYAGRVLSMSNRAAWARRLARLVPAAAELAARSRSKYGARPRRVDGIRFDSTREAARYLELRILEAAGAISALEVHPKFPIDVAPLFDGGAPIPCGTYTADFRYRDLRSGDVVIEDVKSGPTRTTAYRLRKRLTEALHGVTIREI
jgi:hypothetical protein